MSGPVFGEVCAILDPLVGRELTPKLAAQIAGQFMELTLGQPIDTDSIPSETAGNYTLQAELMARCLPELQELHVEHWKETEHYRHALPFQPDYDWMLTQEARGKYLLLTMRRDGAMVGNFGLVFNRSHHTQTLIAQEDTVFILPEHRKGRNFIRLAQYGEKVAGEIIGAAEMRITTKQTNQVGGMLPRMGYKLVANQYTKLL